MKLLKWWCWDWDVYREALFILLALDVAAHIIPNGHFFWIMGIAALCAVLYQKHPPADEPSPEQLSKDDLT